MFTVQGLSIRFGMPETNLHHGELSCVLVIRTLFQVRERDKNAKELARELRGAQKDHEVSDSHYRELSTRAQERHALLPFSHDTSPLQLCS